MAIAEKPAEKPPLSPVPDSDPIAEFMAAADRARKHAAEAALRSLEVLDQAHPGWEGEVATASGVAPRTVAKYRLAMRAELKRLAG